jgi:hypothetical protein
VRAPQTAPWCKPMPCEQWPHAVAILAKSGAGKTELITHLVVILLAAHLPSSTVAAWEDLEAVLKLGQLR